MKNTQTTAAAHCVRTIKEIVIHCSATPEGRNVTVDDIDRWHRQRGFDCIGYHYVIYRDGTIVNGRDENRPGAHCSGHNANSIGICYIGGCDNAMHPKDTRTPQQKAALKELIAGLRTRFPEASVTGHNQLTCTRTKKSPAFNPAKCLRDCTACCYATKACPSFNVKKEKWS